MKRKNLLLALALLGTSLTSGSAMAQNGALDCTSCGVAAPVKMAQVQMQQVPSRAVAIRGDGDQNELRTCCDPATANLNWANVLSWDETTGTLGSRYGVKFDANAVTGLHSAMHNTAAMAAIMNLTPTNSWLVMMGDLRTDNKDAGTWPADPGGFASTVPNRSVDAWNNAGGYNGFSTIANGWLGIWAAFNTTSHSTTSMSFGQSSMNFIAPPHMRGDLTRYTMKTSLWLWYRVGQVWYQREVLCNNVPRKYFGWQRGGAPGQKVSTPSIITESSESVEKGMRLGTPIRLTPEQIKQAEEAFGKISR